MGNVKTKFFHFRQNNSGGSFVKNDALDVLVIIEATDYHHANVLAENKGIYFDGVSAGRDCSCCGNRWGDQYNDEDGYAKEFNDKTLKQYETTMGNDQYAMHFVLYYLDGRVVRSRGRILSHNADRW